VRVAFFHGASAMERSTQVTGSQDDNGQVIDIDAGSLFVLAAIAFTVPASAQGTAQQRTACMGDAFRFCSADIPNVSRIETCLLQNRERLRPAYLLALSFTVYAAYRFASPLSDISAESASMCWFGYRPSFSSASAFRSLGAACPSWWAL
jgi:hypothetical protein